MNTDRRTGHTIISGASEQHLEVIVDRLRRDFNLAATIGKPQVAYRETILARVEHDYTHKRQAGGSGQYARTKLTVEPNTGKGFAFDNLINDGSVPTEFIPATAFRVCSSICFEEACRKARPVLLEPVMRVEVVAPEEYMGSVCGDLIGRRGQLEGTEVRGTTQLIRARVPMSELFGYGARLRSLTQGRASYTMHFGNYETVSGGPDTGNEDCVAPVAAPRTPAPNNNQSRMALPRRDDEG